MADMRFIDRPKHVVHHELVEHLLAYTALQCQLGTPSDDIERTLHAQGVSPRVTAELLSEVERVRRVAPGGDLASRGAPRPQHRRFWLLGAVIAVGLGLVIAGTAAASALSSGHAVAWSAMLVGALRMLQSPDA
jgi:hypothetical protein